MRKIRFFLVVILVLGVTAAAAGYAYDRIATWRDQRKFPAKGQLVDLGGYRIHLLCTGQGSPTVLLDAGGFDSLEQWSLVQPEVAKLTRVCSYDRPGFGWSDPSPYPQTSRQVVTELHAVLDNAGISGPYLPVGHSIAGLYARVFTNQYRSEVVGLVLDDSVHPDEFTRFPSHFPNHPLAFALLRSTAPLGSARLLHMGCLQTGAQPDCSKFLVSLLQQVSVVKESYAQAVSSGNLGNLPLIVITHDPNVGMGKVRKAEEEIIWSQWQEDLARLSSDSSLLVATGAGHEIQSEKPEIVIGAIERMVKQWRDGSR